MDKFIKKNDETIGKNNNVYNNVYGFDEDNNNFGNNNYVYENNDEFNNNWFEYFWLYLI